MWRTKATQPNFLWPSFAPPVEPKKPERDDTRRHAVNWFLGMTGMTGVAILAIWWLLYRVGWASVDGLVSVLPMAAAVGVLAACRKLIEFTQQYRQWLYAQEAAEQPAAGARKKADDRDGTWLKGVDGALYRIAVELSPEQRTAIKNLLLTSGESSGRKLTPLVGDKAGLLHTELYRLGIIHAPREKAASKLTTAGRKVVEKW